MDNFTKQGYEEFVVDVDYKLNFTDEETIEIQEVIAIDKLGKDVTDKVTNSASLTNDGSKVSVMVRAGSVDESPYKLTFRCATSLGNKWEHDIQMKIKEI